METNKIKITRESLFKNKLENKTNLESPNWTSHFLKSYYYWFFLMKELKKLKIEKNDRSEEHYKELNELIVMHKKMTNFYKTMPFDPFFWDNEKLKSFISNFVTNPLIKQSKNILNEMKKKENLFWLIKRKFLYEFLNHLKTQKYSYLIFFNFITSLGILITIILKII